MTATVAPARIETTQGRRWWKCPACGRTLGEVTSGKLIIKIDGRFIKLPIVAGVSQVCPRCGGESELGAAA